MYAQQWARAWCALRCVWARSGPWEVVRARAVVCVWRVCVCVRVRACGGCRALSATAPVCEYVMGPHSPQRPRPEVCARLWRGCVLTWCVWCALSVSGVPAIGIMPLDAVGSILSDFQRLVVPVPTWADLRRLELILEIPTNPVG